jgi:hypothetical protein
VQKSGLAGYVLALVMWAVVVALGIWVFLVGHTAFVSFIATRVTQDSTSGFWQYAALERFFIVGVGLAWLVIVTLSEPYLRHGVERGRLFRRFARIAGPALLLLFAADALLLVLQGMHPGLWTRWLLLAAELGLGIALVVAARSSPSILSDLLVGD